MGSKYTPKPFKFDGDGINDADGNRIAMVTSCDPYIEDGIRNSEYDRVSYLFAGAPDQYDELRRTLVDLVSWQDREDLPPDIAIKILSRMLSIQITIKKSRGNSQTLK
jgi:hypothetical protein